MKTPRRKDNRRTRFITKWMIAGFSLPCIRAAVADSAKVVSPPRHRSAVNRHQNQISRINKKCVEVTVGEIPTYFWGIPFHNLAEAVKSNPNAASFYLHWSRANAGSGGTYTVRYDRQTKTLRAWYYEDNWEGGTPEWNNEVYSDVTDSKIETLNARYASDPEVGFSALPSVGCPCKSVQIFGKSKD